MLTDITDTGDLSWNCHTDGCAPLQAHISHSLVEWVDHQIVGLPPCSCGARTFLNANFTKEELAPPIIVRNPDGSIHSVKVVGTANFTQIERRVNRHLVPHPNKPGEYIEAFSVTITDVQPHPAVARHQKLSVLLHASGKPAPTPAEVVAKTATLQPSVPDSTVQIFVDHLMKDAS